MEQYLPFDIYTAETKNHALLSEFQISRGVPGTLGKDYAKLISQTGFSASLASLFHPVLLKPLQKRLEIAYLDPFQPIWIPKSLNPLLSFPFPVEAAASAFSR